MHDFGKHIDADPRGTPAAQDDEVPRTSLEILLQRIQERTATVGVIGLGYVGLPLRSRAPMCSNERSAST